MSTLCDDEVVVVPLVVDDVVVVVLIVVVVLVPVVDPVVAVVVVSELLDGSPDANAAAVKPIAAKMRPAAIARAVRRTSMHLLGVFTVVSPDPRTANPRTARFV
jgi:hypothetical protein